MRTTVLLIIFLSQLACDSKYSVKEIQATFMSVIVKDMDQSSSWYKDILGFEIVNSTVNVERGFSQTNLKLGKSMLELIEIDGSISAEDALSLSPGAKRLQGFFKFGFQISDFEDYVNRLEKLDVNFLGSVVNDPITNKKMVIIKDPDGNRIQLFEK